jgi:ATP-dependent Clp protease ATP-binding subunit ClpC
MYEAFSDRARDVMTFANQEARRFQDGYVGTERILLGLLKVGSGVAAEVIKAMTVDPRRIVSEVERLLQSGIDIGDNRKKPGTPSAKRVIEYAIQEARSLKQGYVGTEHILLALLREDTGVAGVILAGFGLRLEETRREVERILQQPRDWGRKASMPPYPAKKWTMPIRHWKQALNHFAILYEGRMPEQTSK